LVNAKIAKALESIPTVRIELSAQNGEARTLDGHHHPMFARLLKAAASRMANGVPPSIWIAGPAGSGKTHGAHMVAKALNLPWHYNGALSMPHELLGFIDAGGTYHRTPFREAYEHGGVYLFDEVDASDNSALLALNAALANGTATFPDCQITRHPDCIVIATANTWGLGATADYVGRSKIDAAFLSRFPVRIHWDYDSALEVAISGNESFARRVIDARERARTHGIKVIIDPRASQAGAALIAAGFKPDEAADMTYLANLTPEHRKLVEGH
jgi:cobaltochelatase CobS